MTEDIYKTYIEPNLDRIEEFAKLGYTDAKIAGLLGLRKGHFIRGVEEYPALKERLTVGRQNGIDAVRTSLLKVALGYEYTDTKTYIKMQNGEKVTYKEIFTKNEKPNIQAIQTYLRMFDTDYADDDKQTLELKKAELKLKKDKFEEEKGTW